MKIRLLCALALMSSTGQHALAAEPAADAVVANVGQEPLHYAQLLEHAKAALEDQQSDAEAARLHQLEQAARDHHAVLESALGDWLDDRALALEAGARQSTPELLLASVTAAPVTDEESQKLYEARKGESDPPWSAVEAQIGPRVRQFLAAQHQQQARRRYLDGLRLQHGVVSRLAPYRATVPTGGPSRGNAKARITVLEFGDYQCPHCARAQALVQGLLQRHGDSVRVEFHQYPLTRIHPDARNAAMAAECARQQGKFWQYHDALYADAANLGLERLKSTARELGLDGARFASCLDEPATAQAIATELRAGAVAGVAGTPAFYVDGRPVATDEAELERVIAEELASNSP